MKSALVVLLALAPAARAGGPELTRSLDWITSSQVRSVAASDANPGNASFELPRFVLRSEVRPKLRLDLASAGLALVARVRAYAGVDDVAGEETEPKAGFEAVELYASWRAADALTVVYGLQNFQWGPAETLSPSNRLFFQTGFDATPLTVWYGRHLVRANLSIGKSWSAVLLVEPTGNGQRSFRAGADFEPRAQLKLEAAAESGAAYLGVTAGGGGKLSRSWFGEYGMWEPLAGLSIYADAVHTLGRDAWYPSTDPAAPWTQRHLDDDRLLTLVVGGVRYTFEGGTDLRLEVVHDDAGWSPDELSRAVHIVAAARALGAAGAPLVGPYLAPGLELPGKDYVYASAYVPELGPGKKLTVSFRNLLSLRDRSLASLATAEWIVSDNGVLFASLAAALGERDAELDRFYDATALLAAKVSW